MPTAESVLANKPAVHRPPPRSPSRNSPKVNITLVVNSSMELDEVSADGSADLLDSASASASPATVPTDDDDQDDNDSEEGGLFAIGELKETLDPNAGHCWSCLVDLRRDDDDGNNNQRSSATPGAGFLYTTHEHPLLNFMVCSVCEERAEAVESDVIDIELNNNNNNNSASTSNDNGNGNGNDNANSGSANNDNEMNACSWCGLQDEELGDNDDRDEIPSSDLLLCDKCPRAFCVRCVTLSLGGDAKAWQEVKKTLQSEKEWACCKCEPTYFLERLRDAYNIITTRDSPSSSPIINVDTDDDDDSKDDGYVQKLIEELDYAEYSLEDATNKLGESAFEKERDRLESKLVENGACREDLENDIQDGLERYKNLWQVHFDRFSDTIAQLQDELDSRDVGVMEAYYKCRAKEKGGNGLENDLDLQDCKISADLVLEKRDAEDGFNKGEFRGASGYRPQDPRVLKLEPEDLNAKCLNEIEDVNTIEGAIEQMQSNSRKGADPWRSKTGTTELDIEMFRKKAVKFEEINLGDKIDLDLLEKRCTTEKDDAMATEKEGSLVMHRKGIGAGRVVKRSESLRALKKQALKEATKSRLSVDNVEYQPRVPRNPAMFPATLPRTKKRAQLQRLSSGEGYLAYSGQMPPSSRGLLIGNDMAEYEESDITLEVQNCTAEISLCQPLATLLKEHQVEGLKFCWKNVCSNIMNLKQENNTDIHGAILAHNMGLGKSLQAVCLLHTLLTHPLLITASGTDAGRQIVFRAMLIAPVNTLANWETEFQKWVGTSSGRNIPAVRFYPWNNDHRGRSKIIKEWYDSGGILCVSSERYARACKGFINTDKHFTSKNTEAKKPLNENDLFLCKALFKPGPDIVVLDEVHSMLKSNTTNMYKVLSGLGTKLRLGLTGSPMQNNLYEYFRMASWMKPGCLGTESEFSRKFYDPIMDGMAADCTPNQANTQEQVSNEMHKILADFVHRRDADVLAKELPFLQETIVHVRQSMTQTKLYREFRKYQRENDSKNFFKQYHALRPVSNHPACLIYPEDKKSRPNSPSFDGQKDDICAQTLADKPRVAPDKFAWICDKCQKAKFRTLDEAEEHEKTCDGTFDPNLAPPLAAVHSKGQQKKNSEHEEWWKPFAQRAEDTNLDIKKIDHGGKIVLLLQIIAHCDVIGDKVVVFSQSLPTLSYIEEVLNSPDWGGFKLYLPGNNRKQNLGGWKRNREYLRIDGSVDAKERGDLIDSFHCQGPSGGSKLFLISTNAGGLGINLVAANRLVLFDSHWNPAVDLQAVYRCYRYGQTKPTYCYRLLAEGSMEQKIYSRAATKTSLSELVIDEKNPERSFSKQEMDLLRHDDTWVCCNACTKWRMLPPDVSAEVVENLPEEWYCKDNTFDIERSSCDAEERTATWMVSFYDRRARDEAGLCFQPQGSQVSQGETSPAVIQKHQEYTERDEVLQTLLQRSEEKKTTSTSSNDTSAGKLRWVSKWDFNFQKTEKLEPTPEAEAAKSPMTRSRAKKGSPTPRKKAQRSPRSGARRSARKRAKRENQSPVESRLSGKTSLEESAAKAKQEPKQSPEKKAKDDGVVDLTFADSDSDSV